MRFSSIPSEFAEDLSTKHHLTQNGLKKLEDRHKLQDTCPSENTLPPKHPKTFQVSRQF
jgi:hypothetical protein